MSEREQFEEWALVVLFSPEFPLAKFWHKDHYSHILSQGAWCAWQASRKATAGEIADWLEMIPGARELELVTALDGTPESGNVMLRLPELVRHKYGL